MCVNDKIMLGMVQGSGKTFSMFGAGNGDVDHGVAYESSRGIVPRAVEEIFEAVEKRRRCDGISSNLSLSYIEVFGDQVTDLLRHGARVGHSKVR